MTDKNEDAARGRGAPVADASGGAVASENIPSEPKNDRLSFHRLSKIFPILEGAAFDELVQDVSTHGVLAVWLYEDRILDGRNRYRASEIAGVNCPMRIYGALADHDPINDEVPRLSWRRHPRGDGVFFVWFA